MFKNLFKIFKPQKKSAGNFLLASLNDKIMPIDRGIVYEDPLDEFLIQKNYGEVTGGGTMQLESGEIEYCDIEISLSSHTVDRNIVIGIIAKLEEYGAPKGSSLLIEQTGEKILFGKNEGLAIYLDGINLSDEVYKNSDSEALALEIRRLANSKSDLFRFWQGNTETGLYFYGQSFEKMNASIADFVKRNPDCENARIERIA